MEFRKKKEFLRHCLICNSMSSVYFTPEQSFKYSLPYNGDDDDDDVDNICWR